MEIGLSKDDSQFFFTPDIHEGEQQKGGRIIYVGTLVLAAYLFYSLTRFLVFSSNELLEFERLKKTDKTTIL